jgi:transposase
MTALADDLVPDELWAMVEPLLPVPPRPPYGGRHRTISDRSCFAAIVYRARTSLPWRRRARPGSLHADKGYNSHANRAYLRRRGIRPRIARRGVESSPRLGRHRWRVERSLSWLSCFKRLQVRWDRDSGRCFAFVLLACAVVCFNRL